MSGAAIRLRILTCGLVSRLATVYTLIHRKPAPVVWMRFSHKFGSGNQSAKAKLVVTPGRSASAKKTFSHEGEDEHSAHEDRRRQDFYALRPTSAGQLDH